MSSPDGSTTHSSSGGSKGSLLWLLDPQERALIPADLSDLFRIELGLFFPGPVEGKWERAPDLTPIEWEVIGGSATLSNTTTLTMGGHTAIKANLGVVKGASARIKVSLRGTDESVITPEFVVIAGRPTEVTIAAIGSLGPVMGFAETEFVVSARDSFNNPANAGEAVDWYYRGWGEIISRDDETDENGEARAIVRARVRDDTQEIDVVVDGTPARQSLCFKQKRRFWS